MKNLIHRCKKYLKDTLGIDVNLTPLKKNKSLPFFLQDKYSFHSLRIFERDFVILIAKNDTEFTPATIHKHFKIVCEKLKIKTVFLGDALTAFNRKRLIEYKVPFIIPENQMYLPDLGIDLREHFIQIRSTPTVLSPVTQVVIIYALTRRFSEPTTPNELTQKLGYTKMSMSRAIGEIENTELAEVEIEGKNRLVHFGPSRRKLWEKSISYLKTPVKEKVWLKFVSDEWPLYKAGLTALAQYSMLTSPNQKVYAIGENDWKIIKGKYPLSIVRYPEEAECEIEIWRYNPALFSKNETVDLFSLYLSIKDTNDERIESALEEMMGAIEW